MGFEKFKYMGSARAKITIRINGQIGFSSGAIERFKINEKKHCELYFDKEGNKIGLKFSDNVDEGSTTKVIIRNQNCYVNARPFLEYYGISYKPSKSFIALDDQDSGLIVIELAKYLDSKKIKRKEGAQMDKN